MINRLRQSSGSAEDIQVAEREKEEIESDLGGTEKRDQVRDGSCYKRA